jgi:hypothetical protein
MIIHPDPVLMQKYLAIWGKVNMRMHTDEEIARQIFAASPSVTGKKYEDQTPVARKALVDLSKEMRARLKI